MRFFETLILACTSIVAVSGLSCSCGPKTYSNIDINQGVAMGNLQNPNPTSYGGRYPHKFGNREGLTFPWCPRNSNLIEYPLKSGVAYGTGPPGADRIVYVSGTQTPCGCMTHTGAVGNNFVLCKNSR